MDCVVKRQNHFTGARRPPPGRARAEGEKVMLQNHSFLLGVGIGLFCALAMLTVHYVAGVLAG
jgi:hypothetical protein